MKIIALEEHYRDPDIAAASAPGARALSPDFSATYDPDRGLSYSPSADVLKDLGNVRLGDVDGVSMQVLSCLSTQLVPAEVAVDLVGRANDRAGQAVGEYPQRFAAFAALRPTVPEAAAAEPLLRL